MQRRHFLNLGCAVSALTVSGCSTMSLSQIEEVGKTSQSSEVIHAFMITEDKETLVVIGKNNHYIFPTADQEHSVYNHNLYNLVELLASPLRQFYDVFITETKVFHGITPSQVKTKLTVEISEAANLTPAQQKLWDGIKNTVDSSYKHELTGLVYQANQNVNAHVLNKQLATKTYHNYPISITEYSPSQKDLLLSPIKEVGEGVGYGLYFLIILPIIVVSCARDKGNCWA